MCLDSKMATRLVTNIIRNKSSAVAEIGDRLAKTDMGRKDAGLLCHFPGYLGPI